MDQISCPSCGHLIDPVNRDCPHCGVNLALAAIMAEEQLQVSYRDLGFKVPISPELLIPRLGDYLVKKNLITPATLEKALEYQKKKQEEGNPRLLGQALVELGEIDQETLDQVITEQIFQLQAALRRANQELEERVRQRTADLQQALNRLAELNQLKSNFVSNISHELRTPLTHIKGYIELFLEGELGDLTPIQRDALEVMMKSEQRLENLINDLIQFSVAARGDFSLKIAAISAKDILSSVLPTAEAKCKEKGLSLVNRIPDNLPMIHGDQEKLVWALNQLIDNAVKFTPSGGKIEIGISEESGLVTFYVADNGIGIPEDQLDAIFEPFHQVDGSTTRRYSGTGLGLALVKRIIETHGSIVKVESKVGEGSRFEFTLPAVQAQEVR